jgi:hypothetical protein
MGKFQATEGLASIGDAEFSSSLATTTSGNSIFNNTTFLRGQTRLSGSIEFGPTALDYTSQPEFLTNTTANGYVVVTGSNAGFVYPWTTYSGGQNRILNSGASNFVGDLTLNPWTIINGGLFQFEVSNTTQDLTITADNLAGLDLNYVSFSFMTTNSDIRDLKIKTPVYTGTSWQYRLEGSRSTVNYAYTDSGTIASNTTLTLPFAPSNTSMTHVIVDNVQRRFIIHCTNLG